MKNSAAIGELTVHFMVKESNGQYEDNTNFLVYPEMTRTIALLKEQGYTMQGVQEAGNIESITISYGGTINELKRLTGMEVPDEDLYYEEADIAYEDYDIYYEKYGWYPQTIATPETYQDVSVTFSDPAEIAEIKRNLVYRSYTSEFGPFPESFGYLNPQVYFEMGTGVAYEEGLIGWTESFRFRTGSVPQFVIDRILEELSANAY